VTATMRIGHNRLGTMAARVVDNLALSTARWRDGARDVDGRAQRARLESTGTLG